MSYIEVDVRHKPEEERFEAVHEGHTCILTYQRYGNMMSMTHTGVPAPLEGNGIGSQLAHAALEYARENDLTVRPLCSFIAVYMRRHPEYQELLA